MVALAREAGHKSMAVNVRMRAADHTLSADEVLGVREAVIAAATGQLGAVLQWVVERLFSNQGVAV